jgi:hypothetical protein
MAAGRTKVYVLHCTEIRITLFSSRQKATKWETPLARYHAANIGTAALAD